MLNIKRVIGNFSVALVAQGINMVVGIITSLLVPKVMGVQAFGYWQLFIFYISYVGFFHLGINDGVYLVHGGESRSEIDKSKVISQFWVSMVYQVAFALIMVAVALRYVDDGNRVFVIVMTGVFLLLNNAVGYLGYVLQCMDETRLYSISSAIHGTLFLVPLCALLLMQEADFRAYVLWYTVAKIVALSYCIWKTRDFFGAQKLPVGVAVRESATSIRIGVKLMIANVAGMLIMGVARFLIDANWGIETFGMVSFALSMVTFFMMFTNQAAMVLFPALRKADSDEAVHFFESSRDSMELLLPVCYLLYFPAVWLLSLWLPAYIPSFKFFAFLLPLCIFDSEMNVVGITFLKVLRHERMLLLINIATVVVSTAFVLVGVFAFHSLEFVILAPVCAIIGRSAFTDRYIENLFGVGHSYVFAGSVALAAVFIVASVTLTALWAFAVSAAAYAVFLLAYRKRLGVVTAELRSIGGSLRR